MTPHISTETIFIKILDYIKQFYYKATATADESNFFEFYSQAKALLDLLDSYSGDIDPITVNNENQLLQSILYLLQRDLLTSLPLSQLRTDFFGQKFVKRVLALHGFEAYPKTFNVLSELAGMCGQSIDGVVIDVLEHLDRVKWLNKIDSKCPYVFQMIKEHLIPAVPPVVVDSNLSRLLLKVTQ